MSRPGKTLFYDRPLLDRRPGGRPLFGKENHHAQPPPSRRRRFFAAALTAFAVLLWGLQVTSGAAYYAKSQRSIAQVETVPAARASSWTATEPFWPRIR